MQCYYSFDRVLQQFTHNYLMYMRRLCRQIKYSLVLFCRIIRRVYTFVLSVKKSFVSNDIWHILCCKFFPELQLLVNCITICSSLCSRTCIGENVKGGFDIYILENQGRGRRPLFFVIFSENSKIKHSFYYIL